MGRRQLVYTTRDFVGDWKQIMSKVKAMPNIESIIHGMQQLSEDEQRTLAALVLEDGKLEAFVEELEDHLNCERAVEEGSAELFVN
jgi:ABC-type uncharacterized transport system involved in gliding motility auxiliary subunit